MAADTPAFGSDDPQQLLDATQQYRLRTIAAQRQTWFPLLVLGIVVAAWPLFGLTGPPAGGCGPAVPTANGEVRSCAVAGSETFARYWIVALTLAYLAITGWYLWRARRSGVGTRIGRYAWAWLGGLLLVAGSVWAVHDHLADLTSGGNALGYRLAAFTPLLAIGAGLLVLAWVERNPPLAWFTLAYLALAALLFVSTWPSLQLSHAVGHHPVGFAAGRYLAVGVLLLAGSAGFALAERSRP